MTIVEELLFSEIVQKEKKINLYFVFEGANTEPFFIKKYLQYLRNSLCDVYNIYLINKKDKDEGRTDLKELIKIAKNIINDNTKFDKTTDKVIIVFDLDVYKNDQARINTIITKANNNIVFAYTNPAFELFVFLLIKDSYKNILLPKKDDILRNEYILFENGEKERYIFHLLKEHIGIDVKSKKQLDSFSFESLFENFDYACEQESLLNRFLNNASNQLSSNICYLINKIKNKEIDSIIYEQ